MTKRLILILALLCSVTCFSQGKRKWRGNFLLSGEVENLQTGEAVLSYTDITRKGDEKKVIVAAIADGKFGFSNFLEEPAYATLKVGDKEHILYIDPTQMKVTITANNQLVVNGSWTNDDYIKIEQLEERINGLADDGKKNVNGNLAELSYASVVKDSFVVLRKMLEVANPDHPQHSDVRSKQMIGILMNMSDALKETPTGVRASESLFLSSVKMYNNQ